MTAMNTRANTSITAAAVAVSVWLTTAGAAPNNAPNNGAVAREQAEVELNRAIESLVSGRGQEALETLSGLLERHPNFRIAAMA